VNNLNLLHVVLVSNHSRTTDIGKYSPFSGAGIGFPTVGENGWFQVVFKLFRAKKGHF
jgi:hypothetical protein